MVRPRRSGSSRTRPARCTAPQTSYPTEVRIVHLIARLNDGGPARVIAALGQRLAARGHEVRILAGRCAADEPDLGAQVRATGLAVDTIPDLGRGLAPRADFSAFRSILATLARLRPDVVHTHTAKAGALGRTACRLLGLPCLHTYHGHVLSGYFPPLASRAAQIAERLLAGGCHHHALTPGLRHELATTYAIGNQARWHCLPVPVEPVTAQAAPWHARLQPGRPVIGFLGRVVPVKDAHLWLETLVELNRFMPVQGLVCGDGPGLALLRERANGLAVPLLFTGFVPAAEALPRMDLLLLTSRNEGLPLTAVEAGGLRGSAGPAVVGPPVGGLADLIRWGAVEGGVRSAAGLADACLRLLTDPGRRRARQAQGAALARQLEPDRLVAAYERMYQAVNPAAVPGKKPVAAADARVAASPRSAP